MLDRAPLLALLPLAAACAAPAGPGGGAPAATDTGGPIDYRVEAPEVGEGQLQFASPEVTVEAFTEVIQCYYGTYDGPALGVTGMRARSHPEITHHSGVMGVGDDLHPDGALVDCLEQGADGMGIYAPLFMPVGQDWVGGVPTDPEASFLELPPGAAFRIPTGQRWALDLHYINFNDRPAVTNTVYTADVVEEDAVEQWVGAVMFDSAPFTLPPGRSEVVHACNWQEDYDVLTLMAHMHAYGASFKVELERRYGGSEVVFEVTDWTPEHKDFPPAVSLDVGELQVNPGDTLRTTCTYDNQTGEDLPYPAEMCSLEMVAMPLDRPLLCVDGWYIEGGEDRWGR